jgi:hypothetical protein
MTTKVTSDLVTYKYPSGASRDVYSKLQEAVSVRDFGAIGDGITDDTAACQAALNTGYAVYFPEPAVSYLVTGLQMSLEQDIYGDGMWAKGILCAGPNPAITSGDGGGVNRKNTIRDLQITNTNGKCVYANTSPNFKIIDCQLTSTANHAVDLFVTYRAQILGCKIACIGAFTAMRAIQNCNGITIEGNTISGGTAGRAIQIEQSQGVGIRGNIIESSLDGVWIASTTDTGAGNCNGVDVSNNYIEQCSTPFMVAFQNSVLGFRCENNYVGNNGTSIIAPRTAIMTHGRIRGGSIKNNSFYVLTGVEDLCRVQMTNNPVNIFGVRWSDNYVNGTPLNNLVKQGAQATQPVVLSDIGSNNSYDFGYNTQLPTKRQFISPKLQANATTIQQQWLYVSEYQWGGYVDSVEIINAEGTLTGCKVQVGISTSSVSIVADTDISTLTYAGGRAPMAIVGTGRLDQAVAGFNTYKVTLGAGTGSFQIRITFRAN